MHGRSFVVGDTVTVADFVLAYTLDWANEVEAAGSLPAARRVHGADVRAAEGAEANRGATCRRARGLESG